MKKIIVLVGLFLLTTAPAFAMINPKTGSKSVTTHGSSVALSSSNVRYKTLTLQAKLANTGTIVAGDVNVAATPSTVRGVQLNAGDYITYGNSLTTASGNLALHYIDSTVDGEGVTYEYTTDV